MELDDTAKVCDGTEQMFLGYYSWGFDSPRSRFRHFGFGFAPALAAMFVSSGARTFREPPTD